MYKEPVSLYSVSDWRRWYQALRQEANRHGVWKYIADVHGELRPCDVLTRPEMPVLPACLETIPSLAEVGEDAVDDYQRALQHFNDITMPMYQLALKRHDAEWEGLQRVEEFFDRTVSKWDFGHVFTCSGSLRERVANLQRVLEPSIQNQVVDAYAQLHEHLHALPDDDADDAADWFADWSRDLRERLLRCEELHVAFNDDDDARAIRYAVLERLFPNSVLATFSRKLDADVVRRQQALAGQRQAEAQAWAWVRANAGAQPRPEAEDEVGDEAYGEADDEAEADEVGKEAGRAGTACAGAVRG